METIVKFFENTETEEARRNDNILISKTLKKVAHIDKDWVLNSIFKPTKADKLADRLAKIPDGKTAVMPQNQELWRCKINFEVLHGINRGCFILHPLQKVEESSVVRIPATLCSLSSFDNILIVTPVPKEKVDWILSSDLRKHLINTYHADGIVLALSNPDKRWPYSTPPRHKNILDNKPLKYPS